MEVSIETDNSHGFIWQEVGCTDGRIYERTRDLIPGRCSGDIFSTF